MWVQVVDAHFLASTLDHLEDAAIGHLSTGGADPQARGAVAPRVPLHLAVPGPEPPVESLGRLRPAFDPQGTVTAGNASQLSDGASAVVMMSKAEAERRGVTPLGEVVSYGMVAGPDSASLLHQPSSAINAALTRANLTIGDVDLFEINEAFAAVAIAAMADLGITSEVVNVNGGAIALGHPIGMSGNRLALTILHELRRRGGGIGAAALCGGGGQGDALIVKSVS